jgi:glutamyl-tRNA synthetase
MAATNEEAARFEAEGRQSVARLKMWREGQCCFHDHIRGPMEFDWAKEQDHVIQRADGSCLYHLASVVDDHDLQITHVIRAEEHLSNTPRQIFIAQGLGYEIPEYAHLPYVAEPGSSNKLSKRKLDKYLKNRDFKMLADHGRQIAARLGLETSADTFNPVIVDFYREVGYLAEALLNYLLLLGWSLDDKTESFSREEMLEHFSLERVNRAPASFDPQKLWAFQLRHMQALPIDAKVALVIPYLQKAGWLNIPHTNEAKEQVRQVVAGAADRIRTAGDILDFGEFFQGDDEFPYDEEAFQKRLRKTGAAELLGEFRRCLETLDPFDASTTEATLRAFIEEQGIKMGDVIHALRVAVTGKAVGMGMFETLEILGRKRCLARIDRALNR